MIKNFCLSLKIIDKCLLYLENIYKSEICNLKKKSSNVIKSKKEFQINI